MTTAFSALFRNTFEGKSCALLPLKSKKWAILNTNDYKDQLKTSLFCN